MEFYIQVNTTTNGTQANGRVTALSNGGFQLFGKANQGRMEMVQEYMDNFLTLMAINQVWSSKSIHSLQEIKNLLVQLNYQMET